MFFTVSLGNLGYSLIMLGMILVAASFIFLLLHNRRGVKQNKWGLVVLLGPFPIVVGSDLKTARKLLYLGAAFAVGFILLAILLRLL